MSNDSYYCNICDRIIKINESGEWCSSCQKYICWKCQINYLMVLTSEKIESYNDFAKCWATSIQKPYYNDEGELEHCPFCLE